MRGVRSEGVRCEGWEGWEVRIGEKDDVSHTHYHGYSWRGGDREEEDILHTRISLLRTGQVQEKITIFIDHISYKRINSIPMIRDTSFCTGERAGLQSFGVADNGRLVMPLHEEAVALHLESICSSTFVNTVNRTVNDSARVEVKCN